MFTMPPASPFHTGTRRRLDLIFAPPEVYWTAVIGWCVRFHVYVPSFFSQFLLYWCLKCGARRGEPKPDEERCE